MRLQRSVNLALLVISWMGVSTAAHAIAEREDVSLHISQSSASTDTQTSSTVLPTSFAVVVSTTASLIQASAAAANSGIATIVPDPALQPTANATASSLAVNASEELPLVPIISPALGLTGAFLLTAGLALTLIGIKHAWLHVFLSTALLTSLSVVVLIIYVMNPPVSNAVQGAYFVAAFVTGLITGGFALVFKELTEGLGCLLGGFCAAMWFLCLAPGGLIDNQIGRGILIGAFCAIAWAVAFFKVTRTYGLICCTAFAGSTSTMLGIDCFTRAGLKEFWIYIWNLNDSEFPLGTNTYPITRGIRVELACTVVLAFFGVLSQLRIWKVVKERRDRKDAEKLRDEESRDHIDRTVGRYVQRVNERSLARWEATYGGREPQGAQELGKANIAVREEERETMSESDGDMQQSKRTSKTNWASSATLTARTSSEHYGLHHDWTTTTKDTGRREDNESESLRSASRSSVHSHSDRASTEQLVQSPTLDKHMSILTANSPAVIPLPFKVPSRPTSRIASWSSRAKHAKPQQGHDESDGVPLADLAPIASPNNRLHRHCSAPSLDEDVATSVAATVDDVANPDSLSHRRISGIPSIVLPKVPTDVDMRVGDDNQRASFVEHPVEEDDEEAVVRSTVENRAASSEAQSMSRVPSHRDAHFRQSITSSAQPDLVDRQTSAAVTRLSEHLDDRVSRVITTFRTNEWAKHIAEAEIPIEEELPPASPGTKLDPVFAREAAKEEITAGPVAAVAEESHHKDETRLDRNRDSIGSKVSSAPHQSQSGATSVTILGRSVSEISLQRSGSAHLVNSRDSLVAARNTSKPPTAYAMPLSAQPLVESLAEENTPTTPAPTHRPAQRVNSSQSDIRKGGSALRPGASSLPMLYATPNVQDTFLLHSGSQHKSVKERIGASNVTTTTSNESAKAMERKSSAHSNGRRVDGIAIPNATPDRGLQRRLSNHSITPFSMTSPVSSAGQASRPGTPGHPTLIYDSHQPRREHGVDTERQAMLQAQWRESLQQSLSSPLMQPAHLDAAHTTMMNERRQTERQQAKRASRQTAIDAAMRSGQMHNAHRDAMRKMQARARRLSEV